MSTSWPKSSEADETSPLQGGKSKADAEIKKLEQGYQKFGQSPSHMSADDKNERQKDLTKARTHLQKFLFFFITSFQAYVVYMISRNMTFGVSVLRTTGGPVRSDFMWLIYASFGLSTLSFFTTALLNKG
jgi:hypothetical protein